VDSIIKLRLSSLSAQKQAAIPQKFGRRNSAGTSPRPTASPTSTPPPRAVRGGEASRRRRRLR